MQAIFFLSVVGVGAGAAVVAVKVVVVAVKIVVVAVKVVVGVQAPARTRSPWRGAGACRRLRQCPGPWRTPSGLHVARATPRPAWGQCPVRSRLWKINTPSGSNRVTHPVSKVDVSSLQSMPRRTQHDLRLLFCPARSSFPPPPPPLRFLVQGCVAATQRCRNRSTGHLVHCGVYPPHGVDQVNQPGRRKF